MNNPGSRAARFLVMAMLVLVFCAACMSQQLTGTEYRTFASPDGLFKVVVYRAEDAEVRAPGQSGDAGGFVRLITAEGRVLEEQEVEMVQLIDQVDWAKDRVSIKLFAEWDLPR